MGQLFTSQPASDITREGTKPDCSNLQPYLFDRTWVIGSDALAGLSGSSFIIEQSAFAGLEVNDFHSSYLCRLASVHSMDQSSINLHYCRFHFSRYATNLSIESAQ